MGRNESVIYKGLVPDAKLLCSKIGLRSGVEARRGGGMSLLSSETMTTTGRQKINKK